MKLAVVGAGSTYTPELVAGLAGLEVERLALHDVDPGRLEVVGGLAGRMLERVGFAGELSLGGELERAVEGADYVLVQIRVGGQAARLHDETAPLPCGCIGQETTGAGGFAKAMRTVPVVLEIAERVRELAGPDAWIVDFTNPVGIVTRALLDAGHRAVGLCNVAITLQRRCAALLGVEPARVVVDQVGLNHLTWVRGVLLDGGDVLPALLEERGDELAEEVQLPRRLLEELGAVPSYYLRYFYEHDAVLAEQLDGVPRAETVAAIERGLLELYRDPEPEREARAPRAARRGVLQRGGGGARARARVRHRRRPRGRRPQRRHALGASGRRRRRGAGAGRRRADRAARAAPARPGAPRPRPARRRLRAAGGRGRGHPRPGDREEGAAHASADRAVRALRGAARPARARGGGGMTVVLAVDGGNSKTDLALVGSDGALLAFARGSQSSPHHIGEDGAMGVLAGLVEEVRA